MSHMNKVDNLVPPGGMYVRVPIPAMNYLFDSGLKSEGHVLFALCLFLGKNSNVVFPGYPTIASIARISENNLKVKLEKLVSLGFISIQKKGRGRNGQNFYTILPQSYLEKKMLKSPERFILPSNKIWVCHTCYANVTDSDVEYIQKRDWEGNADNHWRHRNCNGSARVVEQSPGILMDRKSHIDYLASLEVGKSQGSDLKTKTLGNEFADSQSDSFKDPWVDRGTD